MQAIDEAIDTAERQAVAYAELAKVLKHIGEAEHVNGYGTCGAAVRHDHTSYVTLRLVGSDAAMVAASFQNLEIITVSGEGELLKVQW